VRVEIRGAVQGVGFRPFVFRLAHESGLKGWVANDARGVVLEVEGPTPALERFLERLPAELPAPAGIQEQSTAWLDPVGYGTFEIKSSDESGPRTAEMLPDIATCAACLRELFDPQDRRHGYPFTNCTHCGPRLTIIHALPYDRPGTSMESFTLCPACRTEYEDPTDRRFHAQPNACAECGPRVRLLDSTGALVTPCDDVIASAAAAIERGEVLAVKGLGGFHLIADAGNPEPIRRLREGKPRREKPFAVMARDEAQAEQLCRIDETERQLLSSPEAPIVLLSRRSEAEVADAVAPGNPRLGLMLPGTPLHHLLMSRLARPVVATSGNLSEEPICTTEDEAVERLRGVADGFLVHDRPIVRHVDDSVVRIVGGGPTILRRARGYAPRPVQLASEGPGLLAVGAHLKNTVALNVGRQVFVSQHIGDMETAEALRAFERVITDFVRLYDVEPVAIAHDLHPGYVSTTWAREAVTGASSSTSSLSRLRGLELIPVQHHHAHLAACLAEHRFDGDALGVTWDGTGHGVDGTVWGGEFLVGSAAGFRRVAHLRSFRLPGNAAAIREPRRSAMALLWELDELRTAERLELAPLRSFGEADRRLLCTMLERGLQAPVTTSAGRLFDGVAALLDLHQRSSYEGQAAMALEFVADRTVGEAYPVELLGESQPSVVDWGPALVRILEDLEHHVAPGTISARFHNMLADSIVLVAREAGESTVALSGGCFQNELLVERTTSRLRASGFDVLCHRQVPPNDGGISLGQLAVAAAVLRGRSVEPRV
jgi:hydrogenase maturation protein HypF